MKNELNYFNIEGLYGGNQELFSDLWMRGGGCAAVTACDLCIYLDLYKGTADAGGSLYPFNPRNLTKADYERFAMRMKPYLRPRFSGIDKLEIYIKGLGRYLSDRGCGSIQLSAFPGELPYTQAREFLTMQIDAGYPVPMLNLRHRDKAFSDFEWHWFLLTGYESLDEELKVKVVSYGEFVWLDFRSLWNTGYRQKGGMIMVRDKNDLISFSEELRQSVRDTGSQVRDGAPEDADEVKFDLTDQYLFRRLAELTAIDSLSSHERAMADRLKTELASLGIDAGEDDSKEQTGGDTGNLYAFIPGNIPGPPLLLSAHMDTVTPGIGKCAVWDREKGVINSDGTTVLGSDDAAGLLEILEALRIITSRDLPHRDIELLFTTAEETYGRGSAAFDYSRLRAKEAYVLDMDGAVGRATYKAPSIIAFEAGIIGKAAHAGFAPEKGIHAINIMSHAVTEVRQGRIDEETVCNIGMIRGGEATNIIPDSCTCRGEVRSFSHEKAMACLDDIREVFASAAKNGGAKSEFSYSIGVRAYETDLSLPVAKHFSDACEMLERKAVFEKSLGGSDNNQFAQHGIAGLVLACGMENVHTVSEYIRISDIRDAIMLILCLVIQEE